MFDPFAGFPAPLGGTIKDIYYMPRRGARVRMSFMA